MWLQPTQKRSLLRSSWLLNGIESCTARSPTRAMEIKKQGKNLSKRESQFMIASRGAKTLLALLNAGIMHFRFSFSMKYFADVFNSCFIFSSSLQRFTKTVKLFHHKSCSTLICAISALRLLIANSSVASSRLLLEMENIFKAFHSWNEKSVIYSRRSKKKPSLKSSSKSCIFKYSHFSVIFFVKFTVKRFIMMECIRCARKRN